MSVQVSNVIMSTCKGVFLVASPTTRLPMGSDVLSSSGTSLEEREKNSLAQSQNVSVKNNITICTDSACHTNIRKIGSFLQPGRLAKYTLLAVQWGPLAELA